MDKKKIRTDVYEVLNSRKWDLIDDGIYTLKIYEGYCAEADKDFVESITAADDPCDKFYDKLYALHSDDESDFQSDMERIVCRALIDRYKRPLCKEEEDFVYQMVQDVVQFEPPFDYYKLIKCLAELTVGTEVFRVSMRLMDVINIAYIIKHKTGIVRDTDKKALILPLSKHCTRRLGRKYASLDELKAISFITAPKQNRKFAKPGVFLPEGWTEFLLELE